MEWLERSVLSTTAAHPSLFLEPRLARGRARVGLHFPGRCVCGGAARTVEERASRSSAPPGFAVGLLSTVWRGQGARPCPPCCRHLQLLLSPGLQISPEPLLQSTVLYFNQPNLQTSAGRRNWRRSCVGCSFWAPGRPGWRQMRCQRTARRCVCVCVCVEAGGIVAQCVAEPVCMVGRPVRARKQRHCKQTGLQELGLGRLSHIQPIYSPRTKGSQPSSDFVQELTWIESAVAFAGSRASSKAPEVLLDTADMWSRRNS